jgi:VWFA-related protein
MPVPKWFLRFALTLLFSLPATASDRVAAQSPVSSNPSPSTNAKTEPISLDLIALDRHGQPVTDLKPDEVHLTLNKVEQKIERLTPAAGEPLTIGLFFDVSGSRHLDTHVEDETQLASELLRTIWREGDAGFLIAFNDEAWAVVQPTHKLEEINKGLKQILETEPRGSTALYDALCLVKPEQLNAVPGRKAYVVFSDFEDNASKNKADNVLAVAHQAGIFIFPVILGGDFVRSRSNPRQFERLGRQAQKIVDATGGEVLIPESQKQLPKMIERLADDLKGFYRLVYTPSEPGVKGKKNLRLETTRPQVNLLYPK